MTKNDLLNVISCFVLVWLFGCGAREPLWDDPTLSVKEPYNIILITVNTLRADHVSSMGYYRNTTPHFDEFASNNILFTNAFATSSWQMPATGSLFTSLYPTEHGATHVDHKLGPFPTLAGILNENGYYTAGFGCNPRLTYDYGFGQGFQFYDDFSVVTFLEQSLFDRLASININQERTNDLINDSVTKWLQHNTHSPFFLYVHYYDNHWDYLPPEPYKNCFNPDYQGNIDGTNIAREPLYSNKPSDEDVEQIIALYDGQVKQTDQDIGELLEFLRMNGFFDNSIIVIMGEHGEQFYEHGNTSHHGVYEVLTHVPLAMSLPNSKPNKVIDSLISGVDILPTLLDYAGAPIPENSQGKSMKALIKGKADKIRDFVIIEYTGGAATIPDTFSIRFERYKFIYQEDTIFAYDLLTDAGEQKKIYQTDFNEEMNILFLQIDHLLLSHSGRATE